MSHSTKHSTIKNILRQKELEFPTRRSDELQIIRNSRVGDSYSKLLLRTLDCRIGGSNKTWTISIPELANEMECSEATVIRRVRDLTQRCLLIAELVDVESQEYEFQIVFSNLADLTKGRSAKPKRRRGRARKPHEFHGEESEQNFELTDPNFEQGVSICELTDPICELTDPASSYKRPKSAHSAQEVCPEQAPDRPSDASDFVFDCVGKGPRSWTLSRSKLEEYMECYPDLDVRAEIRKARQWIRDNPTKRKTAGGMPAFLTRWLNRSQNFQTSKGPRDDCTAKRKADYARTSIEEAFGSSDDEESLDDAPKLLH